MLFVAAAGNSGQDLDNVSRPSIPASFDLPNILSVAAVDNTGQLASFSNYGETSVDVSAPGVDIASSSPTTASTKPATTTSTGRRWPRRTCRRSRRSSGRRPRPARHADRSQEADPRHRQERRRHGRPDAHGSRGERGRRDRPDRSDGVRAEQLLVRHRWAIGSTIIDSRPLAGGHRRPQRCRLVRAAPVGQRRRLDHRHRLDHGLSIDRSLTFSTAYRYRVRAHDRAGNTGAYVDGPQVRPKLTQQNGTGVTYGGTWTGRASSSASGGSTRYATKAGAWVQFSFTGRAVAVVAPKGASRGSARPTSTARTSRP